MKIKNGNSKLNNLQNLNFIQFSEKRAREHLTNLSSEERKKIVDDLNIGLGWDKVDQNMFKDQLVERIIKESVKPYHYLYNSLIEDQSEKIFKEAKSTKMCSNNGFWISYGKIYTFNWLKKKIKSYLNNFKSVVHFVQRENGTGVNISKDGLILTCAHVISHGDDPLFGVLGKKRIGRKKTVMFPDGEVCACVCTKVIENDNGNDDLALLKVIKSNNFNGGFPYSQISKHYPNLSDDLFCIGNPSDLDLESGKKQYNGFYPAVWHLSVGKFRGISRKSLLGKYQHTCWTYWGHSGAPLFNRNGKIVGIHNSWDNHNGMRHAVDLDTIKKIVE